MIKHKVTVSGLQEPVGRVGTLLDHIDQVSGTVPRTAGTFLPCGDLGTEAPQFSALLSHRALFVTTQMQGRTRGGFYGSWHTGGNFVTWPCLSAREAGNMV